LKLRSAGNPFEQVLGATGIVSVTKHVVGPRHRHVSDFRDGRQGRCTLRGLFLPQLLSVSQHQCPDAEPACPLGEPKVRQAGQYPGLTQRTPDTSALLNTSVALFGQSDDEATTLTIRALWDWPQSTTFWIRCPSADSTRHLPPRS